MREIDYGALVMLVESNWEEFVDYAGSEEEAEAMLALLKEEAGM